MRFKLDENHGRQTIDLFLEPATISQPSRSRNCKAQPIMI